MELRCLLSRSLPPLSPACFPSRSINTHVTEQRKSFNEFESLRSFDRKPDFSIEGLKGLRAKSCCHCVLTKTSETETRSRSPFRDNDDHDLNLINVEESNNGFVLFKFGMADSCEDSSMFIPSSEHKIGTSAVSTLSEYVSDAIIPRNLDDSRGFPIENLGALEFAKAYNDSSLSRDLTSVPAGQIFKSPFCECPDKGSSFGPICTAENIGEEAFDKIPMPDLPETNLESNELLSFPPVFTEIPQPVKSPSYFSSGSEGSGFITAAGHDGFQFKSPHSVEVHFTDDSAHGGVGSAIMMVENKGSPMYFNHEEAGMVKPQGTCSPKATATKRIHKTKKKGGLPQRKSGKVVTRDVCRRSSFQLYEIILSYPFTKSSEAVLNFQTVPKEEFGGLFNIFNQIAVGLAGSGLALVLFVVSRMLSLNATLDSSKLMYLLRGIGLLWLSSALHKCGGAVRCMADVCTQARSQRKESLATFRREVQAVTFKACAVVVLSMVRFV